MKYNEFHYFFLIFKVLFIAQKEYKYYQEWVLSKRKNDDLLNELAGALDPTDAVALAYAPIALSRRAIRSWLTNPLVPDSATVERVLEVARGNTLACDIGLGRQVRRSQQRLRITEAETSK